MSYVAHSEGRRSDGLARARVRARIPLHTRVTDLIGERITCALSLNVVKRPWRGVDGPGVYGFTKSGAENQKTYSVHKDTSGDSVRPASPAQVLQVLQDLWPLQDLHPLQRLLGPV